MLVVRRDFLHFKRFLGILKKKFEGLGDIGLNPSFSFILHIEISNLTFVTMV